MKMSQNIFFVYRCFQRFSNLVKPVREYLEGRQHVSLYNEPILKQTQQSKK